MKRSEIFFTLILLPLDYLATISAFIYSYYLRQKINLDPQALGSLSKVLQIEQFEFLPPFSDFISLSFVLGVALLIIFALIGLYQIKTAIYNFKELPKVIFGVSGLIALIILLSFFLRTFLFPRLIILFFWIIAIIFITISRLIIRLIQRSLYRYEIGIIRVAVIGDNGLTDNIASQIQLMGLQGFKLYQRYRNNELEKLINDLDKRKIDQVIVADHKLANNQLTALREKTIEKTCRFTYIPNLFEVSNSRVEIFDLQGIPIIEVKPTPLDGWGRILKRMTDLILSLVALTILLPLILIISLLIKILIPGPVFFRHKRLGLSGKMIEIYKFRSMNYIWCDQVIYKGKSGLDRFREYLEQHPEAKKEWQEKQKLKNDPRISGFGHILRKTNLDELPQFFNVFRGDLSLVGPRPIIENEKERYGFQSGRLLTIKPGITGLWQVSGRSELTYEERVRLDIFYVENWSFWWDITILFKTLAVIFGKGKGAY